MPLCYSGSVTIAPDVLFRVVGDEAVLLNLKTQLYLGLDPIGTRMWTVFQASASLQEAFECLLGEFNVDAVRLRTDLDELLSQLQAQGLVKFTPGEAS